eukprot:15798_1
MFSSAKTFILLLATCIHGAIIPITNPGFEDDKPNCPNNTFWYFNGSAVHGWDAYDPHSDIFVGIECPSQDFNHQPVGTIRKFGTTFNDSKYGHTAPEGHKCVYIAIDGGNPMGAGPCGIEQILSGNVLTANTRYTLTAQIANPRSNCYTNSTDGPNKCTLKSWANSSPGPGYQLQLIAGNTVIAEDDNSISIPKGQWRLSSVTFVASNSNMQLGRTLAVRILLRNKVNDTGFIEVDDVRLETVILTSAPIKATDEREPTIDPTIGPTSVTHDTTNTDPNMTIVYIVAFNLVFIGLCCCALMCYCFSKVKVVQDNAPPLAKVGSVSVSHVDNHSNKVKTEVVVPSDVERVQDAENTEEMQYTLEGPQGEGQEEQ